MILHSPSFLAMNEQQSTINPHSAFHLRYPIQLRKFDSGKQHYRCNILKYTMPNRLRVRYWVAVLSKDHVKDAVKKGYCEFKNGTRLPFKNVNPHSWFVYYSPGTKPLQVIREKGREAGRKVQAFTAIGQVLPGEPYSVDTGHTRVYRRRARYVPNSSDAPLAPLMPELSFFKKHDKSRPWGIQFQGGLIEVKKTDFFALCKAMNVDMPKRHALIFEKTNVNIQKPDVQQPVGQNLKQDPPITDSTELTNDTDKLPSKVESNESVEQSQDVNGVIEIKEEQQPQEVNESPKLELNDQNITDKIKESGGESRELIAMDPKVMWENLRRASRRRRTTTRKKQ